MPAPQPPKRCFNQPPTAIPAKLFTLLSPFQLVPGFRPLLSGIKYVLIYYWYVMYLYIRLHVCNLVFAFLFCLSCSSCLFFLTVRSAFPWAEGWHQSRRRARAGDLRTPGQRWPSQDFVGRIVGSYGTNSKWCFEGVEGGHPQEAYDSGRTNSALRL